MTRRMGPAVLVCVFAATITTFGQSVHLNGSANAEPNFVRG